MENPNTGKSPKEMVQVGLEFQGAAESELDISGLTVLSSAPNFVRLKIAGNLIEPSPLRGFKSAFEVVGVNRLVFVRGTEGCEWWTSEGEYPVGVEHEREVKCDN